MRIGERLAALRRIHSLTQGQLSERSGVSLSMIRAVERGAKHAGEATLERIAAALNVPVTSLTNDEAAEEVQALVACILPLAPRHRRLIVALCLELARVPGEADE